MRGFISVVVRGFGENPHPPLLQFLDLEVVCTGSRTLSTLAASCGSPVDNLASAYTIAQVCSGSTAVPYLHTGLNAAGIELTRRRNAAILEAKAAVF